MKQILKTHAGTVIVKEVPEPSLQEGFILVKTYYSLISSGTETRALTESPGFLKTLLRKGKQLALQKKSQTTPLGYCVAGRVIAVGTSITDLKEGDPVVCSGFGYAVHAEIVCVPKNLVCRIPEGVDLSAATFTAVASVALHALRRSQAQLGETIFVVGLGLTGQLMVQLLKLSGCKVIGLDPNDYKISLAKQSGLDFALQNKKNFHDIVLTFTNHVGVDAAILCVDMHDAEQFEEIANVVRDKGRIVTIGHIKAPIPSAILFRREIDLLSSRSFGPGRFDPSYEEQGLDYPYGYVRWTEKRNMQEILFLIQQKKLRVQPLITKYFPYTDVSQAYRLLLSRKRPIALIFTYPPTSQDHHNVLK